MESKRSQERRKGQRRKAKDKRTGRLDKTVKLGVAAGLFVDMRKDDRRKLAERRKHKN